MPNFAERFSELKIANEFTFPYLVKHFYISPLPYDKYCQLCRDCLIL